MKKTLIPVLSVVVLCALIGFAIAADKSKVYSVCNCKDDCACGSISKEAGKCKCGTEMTAMHLLAIDKNTAILCRCGAECNCEISKDDPSKCGCGKAVKKVDLKGKYVCGCTDKCGCNSISDKPGKCSCGKEMKQVI